MKKLIFTLSLVLGIGISSYAQKNVFTVPLAEMVEKGKLYVQPGATVNKQIALSSIFTYGFGSNFQAGVTIKDLTYAYRSDDNKFPFERVNPADNPDVLANLQTGFGIGRVLRFGLGTQSGYNFAADETNFSSFNYLNLQLNISKAKFLVGTYHGNDTYVAKGNNNGIMAGLVLPLSGDKVKFLGDYLSGNNVRSVINLGLGFKLGKWSMSVGGQLPTPDSNNPYAGIIQFSN